VNEPGWHEHYFSLSEEVARENAEAGLFLEVLLFRRYVAKLQFELEFWQRFSADGGTEKGYAERQEEATGVRYRPDWYLSDMDSGFYSADYLRAWIRSAQLRVSLYRKKWATIGEEREDGQFLRSLFREGTRRRMKRSRPARLRAVDCAPLLARAGRVTTKR